MQDEPIDDIVREAANGHEPAFDEKAWEAMRQKLDTHLPQQTTKRRYLLVLLLLLLGGGVAYWVLRPERTDTQVATTTQPPSQTQSPASNTAVTDTAATTTNTITLPPAGSNKDGVLAMQDVATNTPLTVTDRSLLNNAATNDKKITSIGKRQSDKGKYKTTIQSAAPVTEEGTESEAIAPVEDKQPTHQPQSPSVATATTAKPVAPIAALVNKDSTPTTKPTKSTPQPKQSFASRFSLLLSGGADMSYLTLKKGGEAKFLYGAGVGYQINKRLMVRAGVYSVEKVYSGDKSAYTLPQPIVSNPNLYEIDAACRVYEIPVSLSYAFGAKKNHAWFGSVGVASMLMKTENYLYHYKTAGGVYTYSRAYSVHNENNHYFSVLALSAGYQYQLNNRFALVAEPYLKLPLTGIGAGKVKLQGMGVLVTAAIRPFGKR